MRVKVKKESESINLRVATTDSAGIDLPAHLNESITINPGETVLIGTGLYFEIPKGFFGGVFARSGLATKEGLRPANCVGIIDADYRGEVKVPLHNDSNEERVINNGDYIAQLVIIPYMRINLVEEDNLSETERDDNGFGSSGKTDE